MTRSIFDPTGDPERSGSRFTGPDANQDSHLPKPDSDDTEDEGDDTVDMTEGTSVEKESPDRSGETPVP